MGLGGLYRDHQGRVVMLYAMDLGTTSNNEAKLNVVKQGFLIARREQLKKLVVEGYFSLVTELIQKLQQGSN